ncbi:MAG: hypothetical protein NVS3B21_27470 [Acidimicrobiales bacterium]
MRSAAMGNKPDVGFLKLHLPPGLAAAQTSRRTVSCWLESLGVEDEIIGDAAIVVSELVTNGILHASGDDIVVTARSDPPSIALDVTTRLPPLGSLTSTPPHRDEHGRGLTIVAALVDEMVVSDDHTLHTVRCRFADVGATL